MRACNSIFSSVDKFFTSSTTSAKLSFMVFDLNLRIDENGPRASAIFRPARRTTLKTSARLRPHSPYPARQAQALTPGVGLAAARLEGFDVEALPGVARVVNDYLAERALAEGDFGDALEAGLAQTILKILEVVNALVFVLLPEEGVDRLHRAAGLGGAVLQKRRRVGGVTLQNRLAVGHDDAQAAAGLQHAEALAQNVRALGGVEVLEDVLAKDSVEARVGQRPALREVEQVRDVLVGARVDVEPARIGESERAAAEVQEERRAAPREVCADARAPAQQRVARTHAQEVEVITQHRGRAL